MMLQTEIRPLWMKALGALAFGVYCLFWRFFSQRRGHGANFWSALLQLGWLCLENFIEIGRDVSIQAR